MNENTSLGAIGRAFIRGHDAVRGAVPAWAQMVNVVGEAGEAAEAYRRYTGYARREGSIEDVERELADVIISTAVMAARLDIDLDLAVREKFATVMDRGFGGRAPEASDE